MKERRKSKRRPILETFSLFVVVPKKGMHRLAIQDVSEGGLGFDFDTEGEAIADFPVKSGEVLELQLYLNQSLYIPLQVKVARIENVGTIRRIGSELVEKNSPSVQAFTAFIHMLDQIEEVAKIASA